MRLQLKNIGIVNDADIKIDGLTVIAGENDSGKSTVGKVLCTLIKSLQYAEKYIGSGDKNSVVKKREIEECNKIIKNLFNAQISKNGTIQFDEDLSEGDNTKVIIENNICKDFISPSNYKNNRVNKYRAVLIETPFVWNIFLALNTINNMKSHGELADFKIFYLSNNFQTG